MRAFIYTMNIDEALNELRSDAVYGLRDEVASERLAQQGKNKLPAAGKVSDARNFISQLKDVYLILLILTTVAAALFTNAIADMAVIITLLFVGIFLTALKKSGDDSTLKQLLNTPYLKACVKRSGEIKDIDVCDVVTGDIVYLKTGDIIPADIRIIESYKLRVDESSLTGDTAWVRKEATAVLEGDAALEDRYNLAFMNTVVTGGNGVGVVYATGINTEIGRKYLPPAHQYEPTPLLMNLSSASKTLSIVCVILCALIPAAGVLFDILEIGSERGVLEIMVLTLALVVATRPKHLAQCALSVMIAGIEKMSKSGYTVKSLNALETLSSTNTICTNKTGTLTSGKMTITMVADSENTYEVTGIGYKAKGHVVAEIMITRNIALMSEIVVLCNNATYDKVREQITGDPTEGAMLVYGAKLGHDKTALETARPRIQEIPFDSTRKIMSTYNLNGNNVIMYTKGAAEEIINRSAYVYLDGEIVFMSDAVRAKLIARCGEFANDAYRVMACAYKVYNSQAEIDNDEYNLIFVGIMCIHDPLCKDVITSIKRCRNAGINIKMITGDHRNTARAIARAFGISGRDDEVLDTIDIDNLTDDELCEKTKKVNVFARVNAQQRERIINALKAKRNTVAMIGTVPDDVSALRKADISFSKRMTGSDVVKQTADIILADDSLTGVVNAVAHSRVIHANIRKTIVYILTCSMGLIISMLLTQLFTLPPMLAPTQILLMFVLINQFIVPSLGLDTREHGVMSRKPRKSEELLPDRRVINTSIAGAIVVILTALTGFLYGFYVAVSPEDIAQEIPAMSMCFLATSTAIIIASYSTRTATVMWAQGKMFSNRMLNISVLFSLAISVSVIFTPGLTALFSAIPLTVAQILMCGLIVFLSLLGFEVSKLNAK